MAPLERQKKNNTEVNTKKPQRPCSYFRPGGATFRFEARKKKGFVPPRKFLEISSYFARPEKRPFERPSQKWVADSNRTCLIIIVIL